MGTKALVSLRWIRAIFATTGEKSVTRKKPQLRDYTPERYKTKKVVKTSAESLDLVIHGVVSVLLCPAMVDIM